MKNQRNYSEQEEEIEDHSTQSEGVLCSNSSEDNVILAEG